MSLYSDIEIKSYDLNWKVTTLTFKQFQIKLKNLLELFMSMSFESIERHSEINIKKLRKIQIL